VADTDVDAPAALPTTMPTVAEHCKELTTNTLDMKDHCTVFKITCAHK